MALPLPAREFDCISALFVADLLSTDELGPLLALGGVAVMLLPAPLFGEFRLFAEFSVLAEGFSKDVLLSDG